MKKSLSILLVALLAGCMSFDKRIAEGTSYYKTRGYHGYHHPYRATKEVWDCLCLPFGKEGNQDPILTSFVVLTYPLWVIDEIGEAVVDTVLLPVDLIGKACAK